VVRSSRRRRQVGIIAGLFLLIFGFVIQLGALIGRDVQLALVAIATVVAALVLGRWLANVVARWLYRRARSASLGRESR